MSRASQRKVPRGGSPVSRWLPDADEALDLAKRYVRGAAFVLSVSRRQLRMLELKEYQNVNALCARDRADFDNLVEKGFFEYVDPTRDVPRLTRYAKLQYRGMVLCGAVSDPATRARDGAVIVPTVTAEQRKRPDSADALRLAWLATRTEAYCVRIPVTAVRMLAHHTYRRPDRLTRKQSGTWEWLVERGFLYPVTTDGVVTPELTEFGQLQRRSLVLVGHISATPRGLRVA